MLILKNPVYLVKKSFWGTKISRILQDGIVCKRMLILLNPVYPVKKFSWGTQINRIWQDGDAG
jgi:hypothetical protein